ncbi:pre-mRNA-splicing factor SLU7-like isoform X2 [Montipora capricornis]|uniref:pre-mRNA-splicing factor SLU7-like isoform X2 n=1 Tax=Montipora capricornis TaxID=246305 RepID=UPI0035F1EDCF
MAAKTESQHKSRLDWRKEKELEEARKAGTAPALTDEEGKDINPHIPQYISQAPWYYGTNRPTLKHQRPQADKQKEFSSLNEWYIKGTKTIPAATKFRKGACGNCGAMTHKKKDCLERPRRVGAKFTGDDIKPDEHVQPQLSFDYDGKRDRWNGYNVDDFRKTVEEYTKLDMAKQHLKADQLEKELAEGKKPEVADEPDSEDEDKYADRIDMPGQKFDTKRRTTVRNLRIREDTAKYLYNLDPNSAYYDPKTRSMRQNPFKEADGSRNDVTYAGDNFVRFSGDTQKMAQTQMFAWEAYEKGVDVHLQADPTKLELLHQEYNVKKGVYDQDKKLSVLDKYGGEEHLNAPPKELLLAQTEHYVEFSRTGKVIKGQDKAVAKSKYEEDVYTNNHTSVWGSYWQEGRWGYSCCHSFIRNSYCTGDAGKSTSVSGNLQITDPLTSAARMIQEAEENGKSLMEIHQENRRKGKKRENSVDEDDEETKREKLNKALRKEERNQQEADRLLAMDERKRPYNSLKGDNRDVTEEEMEAYRLKRRQQDDPMKDFL